jgi:hypothetical protein
MSTPENILAKIKLLQKLSQSPNPNEAANAVTMAQKLIEKYSITEEELKSLEEKKPLYGEDEKLFHTTNIIGWKNQLALAIASHFECYVVQEETVPVDGNREYTYFVYGDPDDVNSSKYVFGIFLKKVDNLILTNCIGRGPIYVDSYCEGLIQSIKSNLVMDGISVPRFNKKVNSTTDSIPARESLAKTEVSVKEKPVENSVDVNSHSLIKDVTAYFKGIKDGSSLDLQDIIELDLEHEYSQLGQNNIG